MSWLLTVAACSGGDGGGDGFVTVSTDPHRNVMVIDEGFDLSAPALRRKVAAAFTQECPDGPGEDGGADADGGDGDLDGGGQGGDGGAAPTTFEDRKRAYIASLLSPGPSCHLRAGIDPKPEPLAGVRRYRDRWNQMLRAQRYIDNAFSGQEWDEIWAALSAELEMFGFHGTATAGTVAHDNPDVRLVLVEISFGDSPTPSGAASPCPDQAAIDDSTALLTDPDVRAAYLDAPLSSYTERFRGIVAEYRVGVINRSYGNAPRAVVEQILFSRGCPAVSLVAYFSAAAELNRAWAERRGPVPYVSTQSAGNHGTPIDSPADSLNCTPGDDRHLLVGAYDLFQVRSAFSNFGECVDVYAPGEDIIASYGGGWLVPVEGTSFAAPLVARLISRLRGSPYDPGQARQRALDQRDAGRYIPMGTFPRNVFYAPGSSGARLGALTSSSASDRPSARPPRARERIDWSDRALWPLRRLVQGTPRLPRPSAP